MRVLRIFHSAVVDSWRGRERALRERGLEIDVMTAQVWDEAGTDVALQPRPGEPVSGVRTWGRHPALFLYAPRPLWRALGEEWDVIDIHEEPFALATAEILLLRRLRRQRAPYVLYSAQNIEKRYPLPFRWLERRALRNAAGISVCNADAGRICVRKGLSAQPQVIPLGIETGTLRTTGPREAPPPGPVVVGYAGRLADHKGVQVLLDAAARDASIKVRLAGAGPAEAALRRRTSELALDERVRFLGPLSGDALAAFYADVDVVAVPSLVTPGWVEQFGRVAVEAMAAGTPVVATATGALPEVVGDAGVLVPAGDAEALASALGAVVSDPDRYRSLSAAAITRASSCTWESIAADYDALYRRAARQQNGRARQLEVVVVAYGAPDLLDRTLAPLGDLPVTVVDNSSSAAVAAVVASRGGRYLDPGHNGGFAAGVNIALRDRLLPGADVLLLNPDAVVEPAAVATLVEALSADPRLASVAPTQVDQDGRPSRVAWPFPSPARFWLEALGLGRLGPQAQFVIGSVLLLRDEALAQVGPFDESFFLYAEETDWAYRAHQLGWRHAEVTSARAIHVGAGTSTDAAARERQFHSSVERYLRKHWSAWGWTVARAGQLLGSGARAVVLPGERGAAARGRFELYLHGPVREQARRAATPPARRGERAA